MQTHQNDSVEIVSKTEPISDSVMDHWNRLVNSFREACLSFHEGHEEEAKLIATHELPNLIRTWSRASIEDGDTKKRQLSAMLSEESKRIADAGIIQRMIVDRLSERVLPNIMNELRSKGYGPNQGTPRKPLPQETSDLLEQASQRPEENKLMQKARELNRSIEKKDNSFSTGRRKVPLGDVSGMIDALNGQQFNNTAKKITPLRSFFD